MDGYRKARGAVVEQARGPVEVRDIEVPEPIGTEVMIRVDACGLCHSDLHYIDGTSGTDFPYIVGHEIVGRVEAWGPDVSALPVGQRVVVALIAPCGSCPQCTRGRRLSCTAKMRPARPPRLDDGRVLTPVLAAGGLASHVTVDAQHVTPISEDLPDEQAALLGCGVPTGYGAVANTAPVLPGDAVAVIGAGGVGLAAIAAARAGGAMRILAVDLNPAKLEEARAFGATQTHVPGQGEDPDGFDVVIDAVGGATTLRSAITMAASGGHIVLAGAPTTSETADFHLRTAFLKRLTIEYSHWGDCDPQRDLEAIAGLAADGSFPLHRYVTEVVTLEDAAAAYQRLREGKVLRSVVRIGGTAGP